MNIKLLIISIVLIITSIVSSKAVHAQDYTKADSLHRILNNAIHDTTRIKAFMDLGDLYFNPSPDSAILFYQNAQRLAEAFLNSENSPGINKETKRNLAFTLNSIGYLTSKSGNYSRVLSYYRRCLALMEEVGDLKSASTALNNIAYILQTQGDVNEALELHKRSLKNREELNDKRGMAFSHNNMGIVFYYLGEIPLALDAYAKSLNLFEELGEMRGVASLLNNIGAVYSDQGDYEKAIDYQSRSLKIREEIGDKPGIANSLNNIGKNYHINGDVETAKEFFYRSIQIREEIGDVIMQASSLCNLGFILENEGEKETAIEYYQRGLKLVENAGEKPGLSNALFYIGRFHLKNSNVELAKDAGLRAYGFSKELGFPDEIIKNAALMKSIHAFEGNYNLADNFAFEIIDINNFRIISNFATLPEQGQEKYFKTVADDYMDFYSYSAFRKESNPAITTNAYDNAIKTKGLLLKSSTAMRNAILSSGDSLLIDIYYNWIKLRKQIDESMSKGENTKQMEEHASLVEKELVRKSQVFSDFHTLQNVSWKNVQKELKPNEAAFEFISFKYKDYHAKSVLDFTDSIMYCALIIKPESKYPEMITLFFENELIGIMGDYDENNIHYINSVYGKNDELNNNLYKKIWSPLEEYLKDVNTIYLSPSGLLHRISFSAIAKDKNVYLSDLYDINIQSSTANLIGSPKYKLDSDIRATLFGGINYNGQNSVEEIWKYLEGTKVETEKISKLLLQNNIEVEHYFGSQPTEELLKKSAGNSNILHIATHGFFYPDPAEQRKQKTESPKVFGEVDFRGGSRGFGVWSFVKNPNPLMRSGLVMAGANDVWNLENRTSSEDGVLTAQEVAHINLHNTQLVVLSACETGLGDIRGSEGVYGLQRAFKMAGAKYLIMSLWQVPDKETVEFMEMLYGKLLNYNDIRKSFSETQREMRQKYDPFFWAAFVLVE